MNVNGLIRSSFDRVLLDLATIKAIHAVQVKANPAPQAMQNMAPEMQLRFVPALRMQPADG
jgi:hypothetical protein